MLKMSRMSFDQTERSITKKAVDEKSTAFIIRFTTNRLCKLSDLPKIRHFERGSVISWRTAEHDERP